MIKLDNNKIVNLYAVELFLKNNLIDKKMKK